MLLSGRTNHCLPVKRGTKFCLSLHTTNRAPVLSVCAVATAPGVREKAVDSPQQSTSVMDREAGRKLVGYSKFKRQNPLTDKFKVKKFHHIEFWCADATNTYKRFQHGLGMTLVAKSDQSTGNLVFASYVLRSNDLVFVFTAPYSRQASAAAASASGSPAIAAALGYNQQAAVEFLNKHGLAVRAVGVSVDDAEDAFQTSVAHGAQAALPPQHLTDAASGSEQRVAEVELYGDVVLRYVSGGFQGPYLSGYQEVTGVPTISYGLQRLDHAVGNVHNLIEALERIGKFTGFHEFAEFVAADVGTVDSGLNSVVLASNNEMVLLPINEPTFGTRRKSQIQTYLEQNEGPGLQHLALKTDDILHTMREMRARSQYGGFEFMPPQSDAYYDKLPDRIGRDALSPEQFAQIRELGLLADRDDQGILLQVFSKPLGDRPTVFVEIIQRVGCMREVRAPAEASAPVWEQAGGCGGFGKGNFSELFKSIEDYERTLNV